MKPNVIVINPQDNVAVTLEDIGAGEKVYLPDGRELTVPSPIPYSHKVALVAISCGEEIVKYGEVIGEAKEAIPPGGWVHTHNLDCEEKKGAN